MSAVLATAEAAPWHEHGERSVPAALTVERLRLHLQALGITRLARQTGLDRVGIPCFAAMRPAGLTLSVTQGKGVNDASAMASALMEAAEYAIVEQPQCATRRAPAATLQASGQSYFHPRRLLPAGSTLPVTPLTWVLGESWPNGEPVWMPLEALSLGGDPVELPGISRGSNGLASGNTAEEALFHAICELIERDATALWSLLPDAAKRMTEFGPAAISDAVVARMCGQIAEAGLELKLFDQTTDLGIPCVMAVIWDPGTGGEARRFDTSAGYGCHPVGSRAIARAITEAAQTRITNIAGARDDFLPAEYFEGTDGSTAFLGGRGTANGRAPAWLPAGTLLPVMLERMAERAGAAAGIAWAELGGAVYGISVVRALSTTLEDREANSNWRPGKRALRTLMRQ